MNARRSRAPVETKKDAARESQELNLTLFPVSETDKSPSPTERAPMQATVASPTQAAPEMERRAPEESPAAPRREETAVGKISLSQLGLDSASAAHVPAWRRIDALLAIVGGLVFLFSLIVLLNLGSSSENANVRSIGNVTSQQRSPTPQSSPLSFEVQFSASEDVYIRTRVDDEMTANGRVLVSGATLTFYPRRRLIVEYSGSKSHALNVRINGRPARAPTMTTDSSRNSVQMVIDENYAQLLQ